MSRNNWNLGASSPETTPNTTDSQNTSGLWGLRIRIQALDIIPAEFSDVFCQFSLFGRCEESWSTEPIAIVNGSATCEASWDLAVKSGPELLSVCSFCTRPIFIYFLGANKHQHCRRSLRPLKLFNNTKLFVPCFRTKSINFIPSRTIKGKLGSKTSLVNLISFNQVESPFQSDLYIQPHRRMAQMVVRLTRDMICWFGGKFWSLTFQANTNPYQEKDCRLFSLSQLFSKKRIRYKLQKQLSMDQNETVVCFYYIMVCSERLELR